MTHRPCKRLPRAQSCPADLQSLEHERPALAEGRESKVLRTCLSMSNIAAPDARGSNGSKMYTFTKAGHVFNFNSNDTIQSMIDTMGKASLRSSGSCQSISEDAVYNEGLLYENSSQRAQSVDGMTQLLEVLNDSSKPLTEETMKICLHPHIQIQEPAGVHSGLCSCSEFLRVIFEQQDRCYLVFHPDPAGTSSSLLTGTLLADVSFTPTTLELRIGYRSVLGLLCHLEFVGDPRSLCGFVTPPMKAESGNSSLEDPWDLSLLEELPPVTQNAVMMQNSALDQLFSFGEGQQYGISGTAADAVAKHKPQDVLRVHPLVGNFEEMEQLDHIIQGELGHMVQEGWLEDMQHPTATPQILMPPAPAAQPQPQPQPQPAPAPAEVTIVHREGYMRSKAHEAKGSEQDYACGYCGHARTSASACSDGRVRIRCACGGKHRDGKPRMHANWKLVKKPSNDALSTNTSTSELAGVAAELSLEGGMQTSAQTGHSCPQPTAPTPTIPVAH